MVLGSSNHVTLIMGISLTETLEVMLIELLQKMLALLVQGPSKLGTPFTLSM